MKKICCVTGHRDAGANNFIYVYKQLKTTIVEAIADGYTHFICGFADGADCIFARAITDLIQTGSNIRLYAAIPYGRRYIHMSKDEYYTEMLQACSVIEVTSHEYSPDCFMKRNKYMVDRSSLVIAVSDGRKSGGTYNTILYAKQQQKEIVVIEI